MVDMHHSASTLNCGHLATQRLMSNKCNLFMATSNVEGLCLSFSPQNASSFQHNYHKHTHVWEKGNVDRWQSEKRRWGDSERGWERGRTSERNWCVNRWPLLAAVFSIALTTLWTDSHSFSPFLSLSLPLSLSRLLCTKVLIFMDHLHMCANVEDQSFSFVPHTTQWGNNRKKMANWRDSKAFAATSALQEIDWSKGRGGICREGNGR